MPETHPELSPYRGAVAHYLSPGRRDPVKRRWEEPVNHRVVALAIDALRPGPDPVRVVDVGAGTGDGVALLERGLALSATPDRPFHYIGVDPDPEMIATARAAHDGRGDVAFLAGDAREELPVDDVDLYLSSGVPYSHLTHDEFDDALAGLFAAAARRPDPTAIVVDVLGRYSIEWTPCWDRDAWTYDMSFFAASADTDPDTGPAEAITAPMSFHSRWSLDDAVRRARRRTGLALATVDYTDRAVLVGRHTTTGAFNPDVPNLRGMVNSLYDGDTELDLAALALAVPAGPAPAAVRTFFTDLASLWNARLDRARALEADLGATPAGRARLADDLRALEHGAQQGLGTGHSLIGLLVTAPGR